MGERKRPTHPSMDQISRPSKKSSVVNLSSSELTPTELSVLELGLFFVLTPSVSQFKLFLHLQKFLRDVRRKEFFMKNDAFQTSGLKTDVAATSVSDDDSCRIYNQLLMTFFFY